jgi:hypothetical protein
MDSVYGDACELDFFLFGFCFFSFSGGKAGARRGCSGIPSYYE